MSAYLGSVLGLLLLLMVHFRAVRLLALDRSRGVLLCVISGIAVAYVFIDVLPHLARKQFGLEVLLPGVFAKYLTHHLVYLMALLGFGVYVGVRAYSAAESGPRGARYGYGVIVASMCFYAAFIGYMLAEQPIYRPEPALLFAIAMSAHFLGLHHELQDGHLVFYNRVVRYLLMASTALGWLGSLVYTISAPVFALSFAYIAGGIVAVAAMNDLPRVSSARGFTAFALGAFVYSVLLLIIEGYKINAL